MGYVYWRRERAAAGGPQRRIAEKTDGSEKREPHLPGAVVLEGSARERRKKITRERRRGGTFYKIVLGKRSLISSTWPKPNVEKRKVAAQMMTIPGPKANGLARGKDLGLGGGSKLESQKEANPQIRNKGAQAQEETFVRRPKRRGKSTEVNIASNPDRGGGPTKAEASANETSTGGMVGRAVRNLVKGKDGHR